MAGVAGGTASCTTSRTASATGSSAGGLGRREGAGEGGPATSQFVWFDRAGKELSRAGEPEPYGGAFCLSPDGKQIAAIKTDPSGNRDIWLIEWERGASSRFTYTPTRKGDVIWSWDGLRIAFSAFGIRGSGADIFEKKTSGAGDEAPLAVSPIAKYVEDWSRDGRYIVYVSVASAGAENHDLWILPMFGDRKPFVFLGTPAEERGGGSFPATGWAGSVSASWIDFAILSNCSISR